ncbi:MAG: ATP synthase F0 subunit A [Acidobacteria bacterium]|nr:MAG: ATP synthase F0 subunit A [Acidobacteriota bacterium]
MEKLHHPLWIVHLVNALFGPLVAAALRPLGIVFEPGQEVIPDFMVMSLLILVVVSVICLIIRSRLSVENPGKLQLLLEEAVTFLYGMVDEYIGPKGRNYLTLVGTMFIFILFGNLMGLVPGLMAPTSNINVTLGCALTVFVYYQFHGFKEQGLVGYVKHFLAPPGAPIWIAPIYFPIEIISHLSRVLSLSVRLFGNIFGEELVILILFSIVPFLVPLPMMFLGIITSALQAFIFAMLTTIYLAGAVVVEHGHEEHGAAAEHQQPAAELGTV